MRLRRNILQAASRVLLGVTLGIGIAYGQIAGQEPFKEPSPIHPGQMSQVLL